MIYTEQGYRLAAIKHYKDYHSCDVVAKIMGVDKKKVESWVRRYLMRKHPPDDRIRPLTDEWYRIEREKLIKRCC